MEELKIARKKIKMSQAALSRRCGIPQGDISKIETGKSNPSMKTLRRIADALGMDIVITFREKWDETGRR